MHAKNPQHGSPDSGPVAAQPARATLAAASSAMNDHRTLSPISEHPIPISKSRRVELDAHCRGYAAAVHAARFVLLRGVVEAVGRDGLRRRRSSLRRRGVDLSARKRIKSTALGSALEPIRLNYRRFFLAFSLTDAVVDPIEEGEGGETNWVLTDRNRRFELMFRFYGPIKALSTKRGRWRMPPASGADTKFPRVICYNQ